MNADVTPVVGGLADLLSGPLGAFAVGHLRVRPRQARSVESVERLLASAAAMASVQTSMPRISMELISARAGVTPQAAYRYFRDVDELIGTSLRCIAVREHENAIAALSERVLRDETEVARAVVGSILASCDRLQRYPAHLRIGVLGQYRQVGFDASATISDLLCRVIDGADVRRSLDIVKVSVALTATISIATSATGTVSPLRASELENMLTTLFVGVLRCDGGAFDAFREMGGVFDAFPIGLG